MLRTKQEEEFESSTAALQALRDAENGEWFPAETIESALPEKGVALSLHSLLARAYREEGREEEADQVLVQIAERLNQAGYWKPMAHVLRPLLERDPHRVAPLLLRARLQGGSTAVDDALLIRAHHALPKHGVLAWEASQALTANGDDDDALQASLQALPALVEDKNFDLLDEVILSVLEVPGKNVTRAFALLLERFAHYDEWNHFDSVLGVLIERFTTEEGAGVAWPMLRELWLKHPRPETLRSTVVAVLEPTLSAFPSPGAIIRVARINVPTENAKACLDRLDRACRFPPGHYAEHSGWGLGPIRDNDIESVVIDFPHKPGHRMSMATAERALEPLAPDDLRVWQETRVQDLIALVHEDPVGLVAMALRRLPENTGTGDQLRKLLVPKPLATTAWSAWWRNTKSSLPSDPRIDARRAFENTYRLSDGSESPGALALPSWNARQPLLKHLGLLDTFLEQHANAQEAVRSEFQEHAEHASKDENRSPEDRVACILWLARMGAGDGQGVTDLLHVPFDFNVLPRAYQVELLEHAADAQSLTAALNSRLQPVRQKAWDKAADLKLSNAVRSEVIDNALLYPEAALFLLKNAPGAPSEPKSIAILKALFDLLENPPKATHRNRAMTLLDPSSAFADTLRAAPVTEDAMGPITSRLKHWESSDKYRFPLLDYLRLVGHPHISDAVMGHQARAHAKLAERSQGPRDPYDGDLVLSRAGLGRLESERTRIGMELKTSIPRAIQTARELGDLKENAEYKAAKEKQATYATRFQELESRLQHVRILEDLERPPGVALPGTEIVLESIHENHEIVTYWLMGEGDQELGDQVVSYRASLGRALHGRKVGSEVELPGIHGGNKYRIISVVEKLS